MEGWRWLRILVFGMVAVLPIRGLLAQNGTPAYPTWQPPGIPDIGPPGAQGPVNFGPQYQGDSYEATQYPAPQYQSPQYPAPQFPAPQSPAPQYPAPQYPAPQYPAPQYPAPQYPAPQYPAPQYPAPQYLGNQYQGPTTTLPFPGPPDSGPRPTLPAPNQPPQNQPPSDPPPPNESPPPATTLAPVSPQLAPPGYQWFDTEYWFGPAPLDMSFQIGISAAQGNAETFSLNTGLDVKQKSERSEWKVNLNYVKASAGSTETQNNALLKTRHELKFDEESPWSLFTKMLVEYDEFKAFDLRLALNGGVGYDFVDDGTTKLTGRFGAGVSHEFGSPDERWVPEAVFGADLERKLTKRQKCYLTVDYLPEWTDYENFRLVTDAGWELALDKPANLNLKFSVTDRYDSTPNGRRPNDLNYALLLLWKK